MGSHIKAHGLSADLFKLCSEVMGVEQNAGLEVVPKESVFVRGDDLGDIWVITGDGTVCIQHILYIYWKC